jgi:hypothetical protein
MSNDSIVLRDAAGRRRSPATKPGYLAGRAPRNKGMQYPPDPPKAEEIILVMRQAGQDRHGLRAHHLGHCGTRALTAATTSKELRGPPTARAGRPDWLLHAAARKWMQQSAEVGSYGDIGAV